MQQKSLYPQKLNGLRLKINVLDKKLGRLLLQRLKIASTIHSLKSKQRVAIYDKTREESIVKNQISMTKTFNQRKYIEKIYSAILNSSRKYSKK